MIVTHASSQSQCQYQSGFTLIELMIALALGLVISGAVIQVMVSSRVTQGINQAVTSVQENGRFAISRLRQDTLMTGRYDLLEPKLNTAVDVVEEASFVRNHPIVLAGDFISMPELGTSQGIAGANDSLVVGLQASADCRGNHLGYAQGDEFYVVNHYFVQNNALRCRGFDGRVLRGKLPSNDLIDNNAEIILDDVYSFQALYGITSPLLANNSGRPVRYVRADELGVFLTNGSQVVALRFALLLRGDGQVKLTTNRAHRLLNEAAVTPIGNGLFKSFETTITLRNMKNTMRNRKL
ncbi:PilW family protein [Paraglaciecola sp. 20A4]|uniref:PilW family protein n=1 Tax=Paraglaciecola sp. 20A4 TaxID=2687288 RepID=UPI003211CCEE